MSGPRRYCDYVLGSAAEERRGLCGVRGGEGMLPDGIMFGGGGLVGVMLLKGSGLWIDKRI